MTKLFYSINEYDGIILAVIASAAGVRKILINPKNKSYQKDLTCLKNDDPYMFNVFSQLKEYFNRKRKDFDVPMEIIGTDFQKRAWIELTKIPYGETISYKEQAKRMGNLQLIRAVGRANGTNPIPIIIPCHRVIGSDGSLTGYGGGIKVKEKLLELEGCRSMELFN